MRQQVWCMPHPARDKPEVVSGSHPTHRYIYIKVHITSVFLFSLLNLHNYHPMNFCSKKKKNNWLYNGVKGPLQYLVAKLHICHASAFSLPVFLSFGFLHCGHFVVKLSSSRCAFSLCFFRLKYCTNYGSGFYRHYWFYKQCFLANWESFPNSD